MHQLELTRSISHEEMIQVVIKEGELGSLAPLGGDESTIRAQQVCFFIFFWREMLSHRVFDKQGIVEGNEKVAN